MSTFFCQPSEAPASPQDGWTLRRRCKVCTNTRRQSASAFRFIERHIKKLTQLVITQVFDGVRQVLWQDMSG